MAKCSVHPSNPGTYKLFGKDYCDKCKSSIQAAQKTVPRHVEPKECFIEVGKKGIFESISGTGCAHWVSHEMGIKSGKPSECCLAGYTYRVKTMISSRSEVKSIKDVKKGDIWVSEKRDHTGRVCAVKPSPDGDPEITIEHDSSKQGKVAKNEFATYFHGKGSFFR